LHSNTAIKLTITRNFQLLTTIIRNTLIQQQNAINVKKNNDIFKHQGNLDGIALFEA